MPGSPAVFRDMRTGGAVKVYARRRPGGGVQYFVKLRKRWRMEGGVYHRGDRVRAATFTRTSWHEAREFAEACLFHMANRRAVLVHESDAAELKRLGMVASGRGVTVSSMADDIEAAFSLIGPAVKLETVARFYAERQPASLAALSLRGTLARFIESRTRQKRSQRGVGSYQRHLGRFVESVGFATFAEFSGERVDAWLHGLAGIGETTRWHHWQAVQAFVNFAAKQAPGGRAFLEEEFAKVTRPRKDRAEKRGYTPEDLRSILDHCALPANNRHLAAMSIAALAGLRTAEIHALQWEGIRRGPDAEIHVPADQKTGERAVPVSDALEAWLDRCPVQSGRVTPYRHANSLVNRMARLVKDAGVDRIDNGFRRTCLSAWVALHGYSKAATWAGHDERTLKREYKITISATDAKAWHGMMPATPKNVAKANFQTGVKQVAN